VSAWFRTKTDEERTRPKPKRSRESRRPSTGRRKENALVRYFRQTWAELKKVHWPTQREATNLTLIVLVVTVSMSAFLGLVDYLATLFFGLLIGSPG
jgi:preprotein translocase subunit SecE